MEEQENATEKPEERKSENLESVQNSVPPKFSFRTISIVVIIITLVIAFLFSILLKQRVPPSAKIPTNSISPFPTINPPTEWKIFTDPNFNYSFQYPSNWNISYLPQSGNNKLPKGESTESFEYGSDFMISNTISPKDSPLQVSLFLYNNDKNLMIEDWINTHPITYSGSQKMHKDETITINGQKAIKETIVPDVKTWGSTEKPADESIYLNYLINDGKNIIFVFQIAGNGEGSSKLYTVNDPFVQRVIPVFETFVNSLKFTN